MSCVCIYNSEVIRNWYNCGSITSYTFKELNYIHYMITLWSESRVSSFMQPQTREPSLNEAHRLGFYAWPSSKSRPGKAGLLHTERKYTQRGSFVVTQFKRARLRVDTPLLLFYRGKGVLTTFLIWTFRDC